MSVTRATDMEYPRAAGLGLPPAPERISPMTPSTTGLHRRTPRSRAALVSDAVTAAYIHELTRPAPALASPPRLERPRVLAGARRRPGIVPSDPRRGPRRGPAGRRSGSLQLELS
jgi:hypothetical protein